MSNNSSFELGPSMGRTNSVDSADYDDETHSCPSCGGLARGPCRDSAMCDIPFDISASRERRRKSVACNVKSQPDGESSVAKDKILGPVFIDAETMKERVRNKLVTRKVYSVAEYYKTEGCWQHLARHKIFDAMTLCVIGCNAIWIAVDTDYNKAELLLNADPIFQLVENVFCFYFSLELLVRFMAFERKLNALKDAWFVFDSSLVTVMVLETWVMTLIFIFSGGGGSGGGLGNTSILRIARLLRLSRMARMARLLRAMPELLIMIKGIASATRSVFFTLCLLTIIMYVFAIAFTQLTQGSDVGKEHFKSVGVSMYTLLVYGTLLDNIGAVTQQLDGIVLALFLLFVLLAALTVLNMLVGVLCEVVSAVAATEREENLVGYVKAHIEKIVLDLDTDADGTISRAEFGHILDNAVAVRALNEVGVDPIELVDFIDYIFEEKDGEDETKLKFDEFMRVVLQLRGSNTATVKDIIDLRKFVRHTSTETYKKLQTTDDRVAGVERQIKYWQAYSTKALASSLSKEIELAARLSKKSADSIRNSNGEVLDRIVPDDTRAFWSPLPTPPSPLLREENFNGELSTKELANAIARVDHLDFRGQVATSDVHAFPWPASTRDGANARWTSGANLVYQSPLVPTLQREIGTPQNGALADRHADLASARARPPDKVDNLRGCML